MAGLGEIDQTLRNWAALEMAPWADYAQPHDALERDLREMTAAHWGMCLLRIVDGVAGLDPDHIVTRPDLADPLDVLGLRAATYINLLNQAFAAYGVTGSGLIALCVDDMVPPDLRSPIFSFQKYRGNRSLLLPDVDFMHWNFYAGKDDELIDQTPFNQKQDAAIFVGSTTGDLPLTATHVAELRNHRLRAAVAFKANDRIVFHLPQIVQCNEPATEALVRALDVGGRHWSWLEQLGFRYLLSMDGNGATCSRVALSLKSNSVLFKYNSPFQLYYFRGLEAWRHYVPIFSDREVELLLTDSDRLATTFETISGAATAFADRFLSRPSVLRYTAEIMSQYLATFGQGAKELRPSGLDVLLDLEADAGAPKSLWARPSHWVAQGIGNDPIRGFRIVESSALPGNSLSYRGWDAAGCESPQHKGGAFCGTRDGLPLFGVRIALHGEATKRFHLRYQARFGDGHISDVVDSDRLIRREAPMVDLRVELLPRRRWL